MMNRSRRGAARVSVIWIIVVLICFFASLAMIFVFADEVTKAEAARDAAFKARDEAVADFEAARSTGRALSERLGWYDREAASAESDVDAAGVGFGQLKDRFGIS